MDGIRILKKNKKIAKKNKNKGQMSNYESTLKHHHKLKWFSLSLYTLQFNAHTPHSLLSFVNKN